MSQIKLVIHAESATELSSLLLAFAAVLIPSGEQPVNRPATEPDVPGGVVPDGIPPRDPEDPTVTVPASAWKAGIQFTKEPITVGPTGTCTDVCGPTTIRRAPNGLPNPYATEVVPLAASLAASDEPQGSAWDAVTEAVTQQPSEPADAPPAAGEAPSLKDLSDLVRQVGAKVGAAGMKAVMAPHGPLSKWPPAEHGRLAGQLRAVLAGGAA